MATNFLIYDGYGKPITWYLYPLSSGGSTQTFNTGFEYYNSSTKKYVDLSAYFAAYIPGTTKTSTTNYYVNGTDLNEIFQNLGAPPYTLLTTVSNGLQAVSMLTFDNNGNFYYSNNPDLNSSSGLPLNIYQYNPSSTNSPSVLISTTESQNQIVTSFGITLYNGDLYISSWPSTVNSTSCIFKYTLSSENPTFSTYINGNNLYNPSGIVFDSSGNLYVCNLGNFSSSNYSVYKYDTNGNATKINFITSTGVVIALNQPYGLTFDSSGNLYVGNFGTYQIIKYIPSSGISSVFYSSSGMQPFGMTCDSNNNLYINDFNNSNIIIVSSSGTLINSYPNPYNGQGRLTGLAIYNDYIYSLTNLWSTNPISYSMFVTQWTI